ncbi:MAG: o-succinylbenzoate synthase [Phycisphaerae bacterium]|jgi:O-succinylbenzoate synthase
MGSLHLDEIRLTHVRVPLVEPFVISNGAVSEKDAILVELAGEGLTGLGEASPMAGAFYSHHTPESSWAALTGRMVPRLGELGTVSLDGRWAEGLLDDPFAVAGIDLALWDLAARAAGAPLWSLLGGDGSRPLESGLAVGIVESTEALLERIDRHLAADGYRRVKIKVQPGWDVRPLEGVRGRFPALPLMVDANGAYGREHIEALAGWDRFGLMMIEQPLPREDLEGHALLAGRCRTPICLDESAETVTDVERALALKSARIINVKLQRVGTLAAARRIHDLARDAGAGCWMGTMPELGVGAFAAMHFATLPNIRYPTDVEASRRWFVADVTRPPVACSNGLLSLPGSAGLGVQLDGEAVERYRVRRWSARLNCALTF